MFWNGNYDNSIFISVNKMNNEKYLHDVYSLRYLTVA